jgi:hypothetical protein
MAVTETRDNRHFDHRFERVALAVFLIMIGAIWLYPDAPGGAWLVGSV